MEFLRPPGRPGPGDELVDALAAEMERLGAEVATGAGAAAWPAGADSGSPGDSGSWLVAVDRPADHRRWPWSRVAVVNTAPPGTAAFRALAPTARKARLVYDIRRSGAAAWAGAGVAARHLQLGATATWDRRPYAGERDLDVLFMGPATAHRMRSLAAAADRLTPYRAKLLFTDVHEPILSPVTVLAGPQKWELLARARVLIELAAEPPADSPAAPPAEPTAEPDWLRLAQAVSNGCVVVAEEGADYGPLVPGTDLLAGSPERLGDLAVALLQDDARRAKMAAHAEWVLTERYPLAAAAGRMLDDIKGATGRRRPRPVATARSWPVRGAAAAGRAPQQLVERLVLPAVRTRLADQERRTAQARADLKALRLDLLQLGRRLDAMAVGGDVGPEDVLATPAYDTTVPEISVIVSLYNYAAYIEAALDSLAADERPRREVIVVDDASTDGSADVAAGWFRNHPEVAGRLICHRVNQGVSTARNLAILNARASRIFVLDADNLVCPGGLQRLADALDRDPGAAFAYGILRAFDSDGPTGLLSIYPWDAELLAYGNYIDAMALVDKAVLDRLGGYGTDHALQGGMEDYDLWRRIAASGGHAAFVAEIVGEYRVTPGSRTRSLTLISTEAAEQLIDRRSRAVASGDTTPG